MGKESHKTFLDPDNGLDRPQETIGPSFENVSTLVEDIICIYGDPVIVIPPF